MLASLCCLFVLPYNTLESSFLSPIIDNMSQLLSTSFERMSKWETCQLDDFWNRELFLSTFCIAHVWYVWSFYVLWSLSSADKLYLLFPCVTILAAGLFDVPCFPAPSHLLIAAQCPHLARLRLAFQLMPLKSGASVCILYSVLWPWQWQWVVPVLDSRRHVLDTGTSGSVAMGPGPAAWSSPWLAHCSPTFTWNYYVVNICCIVAMIILLLGCPSNMRWLTVYSNVNLKSHFTLKWTRMVSTLLLKLTKRSQFARYFSLNMTEFKHW